jgi:hypothetical protein
MLDEEEEQCDLRLHRKEPNFALVVVKQLRVVSGKVFCISLDGNIAWIVRLNTYLNGLVNGITYLMPPRPPVLVMK